VHQAGLFLSSSVYSGLRPNAIAGRALSGFEATAVKKHLHADSIGYYYSSIVSVADSLRSFESRCYTWATVKLYYSVFYSLRAMLAMNDVCLFYIGTKPYFMKIFSGGVAEKCEGTTHKCVLNLFVKFFSSSSHLLSQEIDLKKPLDWLMDRREESNYKTAKFPEPIAPKHFEKIISAGLNRAVGAYVRDGEMLFAFDPDHAMLAYPIMVLSAVAAEIKSKCLYSLGNDDKKYVSELFVKDSGHWVGLCNLYSDGYHLTPPPWRGSF